jgi:LysM repeat protein
MNAHRLAILGLLLLGAVGTRGALAGEKIHTVSSGETLGFIAHLYYGDQARAGFLQGINGKTSSVIRPGEKLRVPYSEVHTVRRGDTWSKLSKRYLGDAMLYPVLADLNDTVSARALRIGEKLRIPAVLGHELKRGETLAILAERFYGDARKGRLLAQFNGVDDPRRLPIGASLRIPSLSLPLAPAEEEPAPTRAKRQTSPEPSGTAPEPPEPVVQTTSRLNGFASELNAAASALRSGQFGAARRQLESLLEPISREGTPAARDEHRLLLASIWVAYDRPQEACRAYGKGGVGELDPVLVSPKIRATLAGCPDE